jgi:putative endopeptidase
MTKTRKSHRLRTLAAAASLAALALSGTPALAGDSDDAAADIKASERDDWGSFGIQTQFMDTDVKPGDDFDQYVNGEWNKSITMPGDKTRIGAFITLRDLSEERVHGILDELSAGKHKAGSPEARIAASYKAFMDTDAIGTAGLAPARPYLDKIWAAKTPQDLAALFASPGYASPVWAGVIPDQKQSDIYALYIGLGGLGLPDRDYYLKDTETNLEARAKYKEYLAFLLGKAGYEDATTAADAVYALEYKLAKEDWDRAVGRNRDLTYNKVDKADLLAMGPDGVVQTMLDGIGASDVPYVIVWDLPPTAEEMEAAGLTAADVGTKIGGGTGAALKLIEDTPIATWQAYLVAHFLSDNAATLPSDIDDARFEFYGKTLRGQEEQRARWKRGIDAVEGQIGELLGKIYAEKYYPPEEKAAMESLVSNLRTAMHANLKDLAWMGPETRIEAMKKLDAFTPKIGAPDSYKAYEGLAIKPDAPLANAIAAGKWQLDFDMKRVGKAVDRSEWHMFPQTVNAYYNPTMNEIVFPAGILQAPFFNLSADPAVNYGAIGAVIGHEMGHGFDDQGAKSDGDGNLRDWWTPDDKANFEKLQAVLGAQYDAFCPFDEGKTCVNGQLTMGENIGDLGGLSLAYRAYQLSLGGKEAPVIDGYTGDQRFFMAWAQVWRSKVREKQAREFLVTDPHSPPKYRTNGIVRNFDEWYKAFGVKPDDALYLPPEKRVRIW